ncbi:MAG: hypothetical protein M3024_03810 [Candidatus Dormibacteraeota bacterium]|nr:hypothetical protein [Candidatus Dormibacteraeota bacterium]
MSAPASGIGAGSRAVLAGLADQLIPAGDGMPSATQAGAAAAGLDEVLRLRPDLAAPLRALLDGVAGSDPAAAVDRLRETQPDAFAVLAEVVAGAYFLNPDVRRHIGYPGQQQVPIKAEQPPDYEQDGLLASVVGRGPVYRRTP